MDSDRELSYKEYLMRENDSFHAPYGREFAFYYAVKNGEVSKVAQLNIDNFSEKKGFGKLSENPLQNMKYHFVVTAALVARYCIEGGMEHETAYSLSDLYIQKADSCTTFSQITALHKKMTLDYTKRMKDLRKNQIYSKPISVCIDYIYSHLHQRIFLSTLAQQTGLNESYLSRLFKSETGVSITSYILLRKIETSKNMLKYSEYSLSEIATLLAFPNQSYFNRVFKEQVGMTPKKYQDLHYNSVDL